MKRIIIFLLAVIVAGDGIGQMTSHLIGPLPAYNGQHAGTKIPYLEYEPLMVRDGRAKPDEKFPCIIALHGIGERTDNYATMSAVSTGELNDLYVNGLPTLLQTSTSALSGKRFAPPGTTDSTEFYVYAPQCWGGYSYFYPIYGDAMIDEVLKNPRVDPNRIYLVGLSFGAGAVLVWLQDRNISDRIAGAVAVSAGYSRYVWDSPQHSDYTNFAKWNGLLILAHCMDDDVTQRKFSSDPISITNPGSWHSDRAYDSIVNVQKGPTQVIYFQWLTGKHNGPWYRLFHPNNFVNAYALNNGQSYATGKINNMYALLLSRVNTPRRRTD